MSLSVNDAMKCLVLSQVLLERHGHADDEKSDTSLRARTAAHVMQHAMIPLERNNPTSGTDTVFDLKASSPASRVERISRRTQLRINTPQLPMSSKSESEFILRDNLGALAESVFSNGRL